MYNDEEDTHFPGMSVGQTLRFGLQCTTPEKNHRRRGESKLEYQNAILDVMGKVFGITHTFVRCPELMYSQADSLEHKSRQSIYQGSVRQQNYANFN